MARIKQRPLALQPHNFVERVYGVSEITVNDEANATAIYKAFSLDDIYNATQYKAIFEYFKINKVVATFTYNSESDGSTVSNAASSTVYSRVGEVRPMVYWQIDHNDVDATSLLNLKASSRTKRKMLSAAEPEFSISFKPAVRSEVFKSALTTEYAPKWGQYLSTTNGAVIPHFGLKAYAIAEGNGLAARGKVNVSYKMYFTVKNNQ